MIIYVSHSRYFDFQNELYGPILKSDLAKQHTFILPHLQSDQLFNSKELFETKKCDLVIAENSHAATGVGIELGWANAYGIPIVCFYKNGQKAPSSLKAVTDKIIGYTDAGDLIKKIGEAVND